jgi:hypothetical protein
MTTHKIGIVLYHNGQEVKIFKDIWETMTWFHETQNNSMHFCLMYQGYEIKEVVGEQVSN